MNLLILEGGSLDGIITRYKEDEKKSKNGGLIMVTSSDENASALKEADKFFIVPKINDKGYLDEILSICKENDIGDVISYDEEQLLVLNKYRDEFFKIGTQPMIVDKEYLVSNLLS